MGEKIIKSELCKHCSTSFDITDRDIEFYEKISPTFGEKKYMVPPPTLCPDCRQQRRLSHRNERNLYKRKCSMSGRDIVCIYQPDTVFPVYDHASFFSDAWNPLDYGIDFDFSKTFAQNYKALWDTVPHLMNYSMDNQNSEYGNLSSWNKNCYLCFEADANEECFYCEYTFRSKYVFDSAYGTNNTECYDCIDIRDSYLLLYSSNCNTCRSSFYLLNCQNCEFCFMSSNQVNKKYVFRNKQLSKEEYEQNLQKIQFSSYAHIQTLQKEFGELQSNTIQKNIHGISLENCIGDYLNYSKNCYLCFDSNELYDCKFICNCERMKTSYDINAYGGEEGASLCYECISVGRNSYKALFGNNIYFALTDSQYCENCIHSSFLFGCIGLTNQKYCILNKQYTKEEYEQLVPQIIEHMMKTGEWGEFFPSSISPFGYNETVAMEYYPLTREEVLNPQSLRDSSFDKGAPEDLLYTKEDAGKAGGFKHGPIFNWSDYETPFPKVDKIIPASKLPPDIKDIPDDILNWAIECEDTKKPFRILKTELEYYRKHLIPIPRHHPDVRHIQRMKKRNPRKIHTLYCAKCGVSLHSSFSPQMSSQVYCENCYHAQFA